MMLRGLPEGLFSCLRRRARQADVSTANKPDKNFWKILKKKSRAAGEPNHAVGHSAIIGRDLKDDSSLQLYFSLT
jgi:hypothetical protein